MSQLTGYLDAVDVFLETLQLIILRLYLRLAGTRPPLFPGRTTYLHKTPILKELPEERVT